MAGFKRVEGSEKVMRRLLRDRKGSILWVWIVCLLSIVTMAFLWFIWTWPVNILVDTVVNMMGLPPEATTTITFLRAIFFILPIIIVLGLLVWAFVMSQKREDVTYPYP